MNVGSFLAIPAFLFLTTAVPLWQSGLLVPGLGLALAALGLALASTVLSDVEIPAGRRAPLLLFTPMAALLGLFAAELARWSLSVAPIPFALTALIPLTSYAWGWPLAPRWRFPATVASFALAVSSAIPSWPPSEV